MTSKWAKCDECGGEVFFDAWVSLTGELCGGPYQNTYCQVCEGEALYTVTDEPQPKEVDDAGVGSV
jgi:hypothetical protein